MPKAKYEGIYRSIKKRIEAQDYPYQSLLPSENTLIAEYDCSRNTVRRAIAELIADGYVQSMQGRGVRVIYQPVGKTTFTIGGIETFQETARRNRLHAVTKVTKFETIIATEQLLHVRRSIRLRVLELKIHMVRSHRERKRISYY